MEEYYWPKMENMEELSALPKPRFSILIGNTGWRSRTVRDHLPAGGKRALLAVEVCGGDILKAHRSLENKDSTCTMRSFWCSSSFSGKRSIS